MCLGGGGIKVHLNPPTFFGISLDCKISRVEVCSENFDCSYAGFGNGKDYLWLTRPDSNSGPLYPSSDALSSYVLDSPHLFCRPSLLCVFCCQMLRVHFYFISNTHHLQLCSLFLLKSHKHRAYAYIGNFSLAMVYIFI